ncbi:hypothetical protein [Sphingobium sp. AntQ-1]|uniref:hypothetical protein n=1 Tax=Sphingobium sp. AntQ-1 TaxID=2930091 RepID=UPI00234F9288|nr:hypothetical protein [Sphingobium sp. AntQ-1]
MATKASGAEQVLEKGSALTAGEIPDDADKRAKATIRWRRLSTSNLAGEASSLLVALVLEGDLSFQDCHFARRA